MGCIFWAEFDMWGDWILWPNHNGQAEVDHLNWFEKSTIPQSTVGCLVGQQIGCGKERWLYLWRQIREGIFDAWGGG